MRILILNHNLRERGTWHRAWQIGRELARRGHRVTLWTAAPEHYYRASHQADPELGNRLSMVETPSWAPLAGPDDGWGPLDVAWRSLRIAFEPFDLCYAFAHPPNVWLPAWIARRLRRRPLLYDWCDWYEGGIFPKRLEARRQGLTGARERPLQAWAERREVGLERRMPRLAHRATVISRKLRELAIEARLQTERVLLLPNGANLAGITPRDAGACRSELGLPSTEKDGQAVGPWLGYAANYHPDQELLLRAVALAGEELPGLRLLKAGAPFSEGLVRELGLGERIVDLGQVPAARIGVVLGAADALALPLEDNPSNRARVPYKFTDYLAAGRPIVTSPIGDLAEHFDADPDRAPGPDAIGTAGAPEPAAYAAAMVRLLGPDVDLAAMGNAARRLAETRFAWPRLVDGLEAFIQAWLGADAGRMEGENSKSETNPKYEIRNPKSEIRNKFK